MAAHAVEGRDFDADWWRWEQRPAHISDGTNSEVAADHWNRYVQDLTLARKFGCTTLQYGISWARIEPKQGEFNDEALGHYADVFRVMHDNGIKPIVVLQEHSLPAWFTDQGAWEDPAAPKIFLNYTKAVYAAIGPYAKRWLPFFEPQVWLAMAYGEQCWPRAPGFRRMDRARDGMVQAHRLVRDFLKGASAHHQVGLSLYAPDLVPSDPHSPWDQWIQEKAIAQWHRPWTQGLGTKPGDQTEGHGPPKCCFIALTCPGRLSVHFAPWRIRNAWTQCEGADGRVCRIDDATPDGTLLYTLGRELAAWGVPLLLTGLGMATDDDDKRCRHLLDQVDAVAHLQKEGIDLMGFCYHTLLDGFAWHHGYSRRYGLVHVDRKSLTRTPNPSFFLFQEIVRAGEIRPGLVSRFAPGWTPASVEAT